MENQVIDNNIQSENADTGIKFAGFWIRVGASFIDFFVYLPLIGLNMYNLYILKSLPLQLIISLILFLYKPFMEYKYGATLGKMAVQIKVVSNDLNQISMAQSILRYIPWIISQAISTYGTIVLFLHPDFKILTGLYDVGNLQKELINPGINMIGSTFLFISCIIVGFSDNKKGLHDMIANTYCIYK
jgi:uncharacterized RDD family membrane protein YckC